MNQKKYILKKFRKKYVFLQNSLFDFLYWRSAGLRKAKNLSVFERKKQIFNKKTSYLLEKEKICFQDYWKSSEQQKIKNVIQNMNTEFQSFQSNSNLTSSTLNFSKERIEKTNKKHEKKSSQNFIGKSKFFEKATKKIKLQTFQKKQKKFQKFEVFASTNETFIPNSDCFRRITPFEIFGNHKIGEFFPRKKNFQQYWIFPLLGFVLLFSSNSSFFNFQKKDKMNESFLQFYSNYQNLPNTKKSFFQRIQSPFALDVTKTENFFYNTKKQPSLNSIKAFDVGYSYSKKVSKETSKQFQKFENSEFQELCNFYFKNFQTSISSIWKNETTLVQNQLFKNSSVQLAEKRYFRRTLETNRNSFNWKWFSLNSPYFLSKKEKMAFNLIFEIPQKANFFDIHYTKNAPVVKERINEHILSNEFENFKNHQFQRKNFLVNQFNQDQNSLKNQKSFPLTPVFDFLRSVALLNEIERNLSVSLQKSLFQAQKNHILDSQNHDVSSKVLNDVEKIKTNSFDFSFSKTINPSYSEINDFLKMSQNSDFKLFNSFFLGKKNIQNENFSVQNLVNLTPSSAYDLDSFLPALGEKKKDLFQELENKDNQTFKTFFFLEKWLQTQNFWKIKSDNSSLFSLTNMTPLTTREQQKLQFENIFNLDSIYFQKLVKYGNGKRDFEKNQQLKLLNGFSHFSESFEELPTMEKSFFNLKKRTFEFFVVQYYNKKYKDFFNLKTDSTPGNKFENQTLPKTFDQTFSVNQNLRKAFFSKHHFFKNEEKNIPKKGMVKDIKKRSYYEKNFNLLESNEKRIGKIFQKMEFSPFFSKISFSNFFQNELNLQERFFSKNFILFSKLRIPETQHKNVKNNIFNKSSFFDVQIHQLELPILLDFSNAKRSNSLLVDSKNVQDFSFQFQKNNSLYHELESPPSNLSSNYFKLTNIDQRKQSVEKTHFSKNFFGNCLQINFKKNGNDLFFNFFGENNKKVENRKTEIEKEELTTSNFFVSKIDFFEKICEKAFKNLKTTSFFDISSFEFFKKSFLLEKTKKQEVLIFQNSNDFFDNLSFFFFKKTNQNCFQSQTLNQQFEHSNNLKEKSVFSRFPKSFLLKSKQSEHFVPQSIFQKKFKNYEKTFQNFQSRKFEKVFQTFLSPLNKEKSFIFSSKGSFAQKIKETPGKKNSLSKLKIQKDTLLLKILSKNLRTLQKNSTKILFFSPFQKQQKNQKNFNITSKIPFSFEGRQKDRENIEGTILTSKFDQEKFKILESAFKSNQSNENSFLENTLSNRKLSKQIKLSDIDRQLKSLKMKNSLSPDIILKRDGFVFVSKSKSFYSSENYNSNLTFKRFEKEKSFQKKRRLKKQKLETRRRKKRKRFFPRPVWLRFHLSKKFLKTRHPQKFSNFEDLKQRKKESSKQKFFSLSNKTFKNIVIVFPKISKYQSLENFDFTTKNQQTNFQKNKFFSKSKKINLAISTFPNSKEENERRLKKIKTNFFLSKKSSNLAFPSKSFPPLSLKNQNESGINKIYRKNKQKWGFYWKNGLVEKISYKNFSRNSFLNTNFLTSFENGPISHNIEDYKISGEILSEFLRFSWKSYWFQTNFQPFTRRITQNFQKMQKIEGEKHFSQYNFLSLFRNMKYPDLFRGFPIFENSFYQTSQNDLILRKSGLKKFLWYCNIQSSFESNSVQKNSSNFQKIQNIAEYNRILYSRVSEVLKNFKSSENNDDFFFKNFKIPRRKNERIFSNSSIFTKSALFFENFHVPSQPYIPAFSLFSSLFHDLSLKPTGELPTLRALWAFHQTNLYHFQERNQVQNLWTLKKRTESLKSFKGTKKAVSFFRKYSGLEGLGTSKLMNRMISKDNGGEFESLKYKDESFQNQNFLINRNVLNKKILFLGRGKSSFSNYVQQFDTMSLQKFRNVQKKCSIFGINTLKQNSKISLRYLKFQLQQRQGRKNFHLSSDQNQPILDLSNFAKGLTLSEVFSRKEPNQQNSAKSSLNFWWAQKNFQNFQIFLSSQNKSWNAFSFSHDDFDFHLMKTFEESQKEKSFSANNDFGFVSFKKNSKSFGVETQFLWFGAVVFHLAIFATLLKLPEIRTILKFQSLLFYKALNAFFLIIFSIYNLFQKYTKQGLQILKVCSFSKNGAKTLFHGQFSRKEPLDFSFSELKLVKQRKNQNLFFKQNFYLFSQKDKFKGKNSKNMFFEFFVRISRFSILFPPLFESRFQNQQKANQENSVFHFFIPSFSKKFKILQQKQHFNQMFFMKKNTQKFDFPNFFVVPNISSFEKIPTSSTVSEKFFLNFSKQSLPFLIVKIRSNFDSQLKNSQTLSKIDKRISNLALSVLLLGKSATAMTYSCVQFSSNLSSKILDIVEMVMFSIYKFLEKPAELMIEWIALIFLIEWSSDIATFVPDTFDLSLSKSSQKFTRSVRTGSLILSFLSFKHSNLLFSFSKISNFGLPLTVLNSLSFFTSSNLIAFVIQKRLFYFLENFSALLIQPDMDILVRQRKGMIFWDIWAEILLKAAEKYNVNIPSFVTLKEEQELFIEKLLQDQKFLTSLRVQSSGNSSLSKFLNFHYLKDSQNFFSKQRKNPQKAGLEKTETLNGEILSQNSLTSFIENFIVKERPFEFSNFSLHSNQQKIREVLIARLFLSSSFAFPLNLSNKFMNNSNETFDSRQLHNIFSKTRIFSMNFSGNLSQSVSSDFLSNFDRWSCNQYGTYQGPETDLFVDIHPPKSLKHIHFLKYYEPAQYTLGSLICQMYSGLFSKQVSKNILVIGAPGTAKTLFIQALAGETEMKIITDNAYRYSMVQRGVAVGMKYLRDVFDAIALQTPCLFLMEHIHVIGSKRPLLISDDENVKGIQSSFGLEQQEVHETNQMIYQLSRHAISDYKRPYKGDFSMGIPTNIFVQNLYSKSEKNSISIFKNSQFSEGGVNSILRNFPTSPLPVDSIEHSLQQQGFAERERVDTNFQNSFFEQQKRKFQSRLQISKEQIFAPPATSPFTVLMMKEQKKLKPKKIVQESSWGGLSTDQLVSYQKESYSVRAKIALLADITMNLSRGKLDMITDLLVIIDSVRSNRGFVVFATTHLPALLDPALRRPGRFDETISLAQSPNFLNRFEILKMNFEKSLSTFDFIDSSLVTENFSELNLLSLITTTKLSFFHQYKYTNFENSNLNSKMSSLKSQKRIVSQISPAKAFHSFLKSSFFHDFYRTKSISTTIQPNFKRKSSLEDFSQNAMYDSPMQKKFIFSENKENQKDKMDLSSSFFAKTKNKVQKTQSKLPKTRDLNVENSFLFLRNSQLLRYTILPKGPSHLLSLAYSKVGLFLGQSHLFENPIIYTPISLDINTSSSFLAMNNTQFLGNSFYDSQKQQNLQLMAFLSGKVAEFFIQKKKQISQHKLSSSSRAISFQSNSSDIFESPSGLFIKKFALFRFEKEKKREHLQNIRTNQSSPLKKFIDGVNREKGIETPNQQKIAISASSEISGVNTVSKFMNDDFFLTTFGDDQTWRSATPFLFSLVQKRFLFTKNILLSKMLFFDNKNPRKQPPNPPSSSILMPSKKYENFKRTENDFVQKPRFSINEKIQMHQQQRFLKQLYNIPTQQFFRSELIEKRQTFFSSSFQELAYLDSLTRRLSSSHFYQRKYLGIRHRFSNINQWWNGFLPEHNTEATYLSDVDWRTMFISTSNKKTTQCNTQEIQKSSSISDKAMKQTLEFTMDFPDTEQYYNPRNRRWYFNSKICENFNKNSTYWLTFDTTLQYEIYYHFLMQTFHQTFHSFNNQREMLDYFVYSLLKKGFLKELDFLTTLSRFQKS
nr:FtsH [Scenedesmaceae sp. YH-2023b]